MYSRSFEPGACEDLSAYRDILEISDRIKKVEPKKEFSKPGKIFLQRFQILKGGAEIISQRGFSWKFQKMEVQVQGSTTSRMWNASSATKRNIMLINVLNVRPKMEKHP